jgi:hypothetical protein
MPNYGTSSSLRHDRHENISSSSSYRHSRSNYTQAASNSSYYPSYGYTDSFDSYNHGKSGK